MSSRQLEDISVKIKMLSSCVFCKIAQGKLPCYKIYEDKNFLVLLDINPVNEGHTLVIPKRHYETILDIPNELLGKMLSIVKKLDKAILKALKTDSCNIRINQGKAAGQLFQHFHIHLIPRFDQDKFKEWPTKKFSNKEMQEIAKKITNSL